MDALPKDPFGDDEVVDVGWDLWHAFQDLPSFDAFERALDALSPSDVKALAYVALILPWTKRPDFDEWCDGTANKDDAA